MDPTYFMQSQDLRTTDDDIADPINERLTLAERNERLQNQLRSLKEDLSHTRDETGQLLPIAGFSCLAHKKLALVENFNLVENFAVTYFFY